MPKKTKEEKKAAFKRFMAWAGKTTGYVVQIVSTVKKVKK
jgi:hypothetical protein